MKSPIDYAVQRSQRTDAMFVRETTRAYQITVLVIDGGLFALAVSAWTFLPLLHGWWRGLAAVVIGVQLGRASIVSFRRAGAYRTGWLRGRSQMVYALMEAQQRGISGPDWLAGELARDFSVLGLSREDVARMMRPPEEGTA